MFKFMKTTSITSGLSPLIIIGVAIFIGLTFKSGMSHREESLRIKYEGLADNSLPPKFNRGDIITIKLDGRRGMIFEKKYYDYANDFHGKGWSYSIRIKKGNLYDKIYLWEAEIEKEKVDD